MPHPSRKPSTATPPAVATAPALDVRDVLAKFPAALANAASQLRAGDTDDEPPAVVASGVQTVRGVEWVDPNGIEANVEGEPRFCCVVVGDSMEPTLYAGDMAILAPVPLSTYDSNLLVDGSIVWINFEGKQPDRSATLGRIYATSDGAGVTLAYDNRKRAPITIRKGDIKMIGRLIERRSTRF